ncbi:MAG: hypothetical protein LAN71_17165 [Acidobacteriia bacterium]|nr:hypothetical protein [Terriglobia bacterium]
MTVIDTSVRLLNRDNDKNIYTMFKISDIGEKPRWVIVGGDGLIVNKSPTNEELKSAKNWTFKHNSTETCYRCGESFDEVSKWPLKEKDKDGKWIGIWDCRNCWQKYDHNSNNNKRKLEADCRNNNLDPNSSHGIGYITTVLVKKFLNIEDCFDLTGNFCYPEYDMIEHDDWGLIDVKGSSLLIKDGRDKLYHKFGINKNKKADFFFCIGYDKNRKHVIAVYIIPNENDVCKLSVIKMPYNRYSLYNKYKESEEEVKKWDDLFHTMKLDNCPVLRKI